MLRISNYMQWTEGGNLCSRTLTSCDTSSSESNWVVTQYVLRTSDVPYPLRITVEVVANTMQTCLDSQTCSKGDVGIFYFPSNGPIGANEQLTTTNYALAGSTALTISANSVLTFSFNLDATYDRFYVAVVDRGYCVVLRELRVFYSTCAAETVDNVVYPSTPIGGAGVSATASCSGEFAPSLGSSLSITCNPDGSFSGTPNCSSCIGGHFMFNGQCLGESRSIYTL